MSVRNTLLACLAAAILGAALTIAVQALPREYRFSRRFRVGDRSTLAIEIDGASLQAGHCDSSCWRVGCSFRAEQVTEGVVSSNR